MGVGVCLCELLCVCVPACSLSLIADCSVTCVLLLCYKSIVFASSTIFCIFPRLAHNTATLFVHSRLSILIVYRVYTQYSYVLSIWLLLAKAESETSFTGYTRKTKNKNKPKLAKEIFVAFFLHLCKSPDSCTGVCACVGVSLCMCVCVSDCVCVTMRILFSVCDNVKRQRQRQRVYRNSWSFAVDVVFFIYENSFIYLLLLYYYFCFLARSLARQRQRQHTSLLFVYIHCMYLNAFVHVNKIINNWVLLLMLSRVAAWQQRDCDADCDGDSGSNSKLFMRDLMATSFFLVFVYFVLLLDFVNLATLHTHLHRMERERGAG